MERARVARAHRDGAHGVVDRVRVVARVRVELCVGVRGRGGPELVEDVARPRRRGDEGARAADGGAHDRAVCRRA